MAVVGGRKKKSRKSRGAEKVIEHLLHSLSYVDYDPEEFYEAVYDVFLDLAESAQTPRAAMAADMGGAGALEALGTVRSLKRMSS